MKRAKFKAKKKSGAGDFAKTKQKVGKTKAVSENATDTSFKSRSVVILPQLEQSNEPTSRRKLPLQAMLNQLSHYNTSTRRNALSGIEEFFTEHPALLLPNLGKVVESTLIAFTDQEPVVRRALHSLLKHVLASVSSDQLRPFIPLYVAHVSCAFTHIADEIQMDAVKAFQLLLEHHPRLLVVHAPKLLSHLIQLLSRHRSLSVRGGTTKSSSQVVPSPSALLASNPSSKLSLQASRAEVFGQLCHYFKLLLGTLKGPVIDSHLCFGRQSAPTVDVARRRVFETVGSTFQEVRSELCDLTGPIPCVAVLRNSGIRITDTVSATTGTNQALGSESSLFFSGRDELWLFLHTLFSLLLECWLECSPSRLSLANTSVKSLELGLMETIVNLLCLVVEVASAVDGTLPGAATPFPAREGEGTPKLVEKLGGTFFGELKRHVLAHFPFLCPPGGRGVLMNLTVCKTFLLLLNGAPSCPAPSSSIFESVCSFLAGLDDCTGVIAGSSHLTGPCFQCVADVVPLFVRLASRCGGVAAHGTEEEILASFLSLYEATCSQSCSRHVLIVCFEKLLASELKAQRRGSLLMTKLLLPWLQNLPNLLVELGSTSPELSTVVADILASAAVCGVDVHMETMGKSLRRVFDSQVSLLFQLPAFTQRKVVELLWHTPELSADDLRAISGCLLSGKLDCPTALYLIQLIHLKLVGLGNDVRNPGPSIALDLSFFLTLIVGYSREQLAAFPTQLQQSWTTSDLDPVLIKPGAGRDLEYRMGILKCACECLRTTSFSDQVLTLMQSGLVELMCPESHQGLPYDVAVGVLTLFTCFLSSREIIPDPLVTVTAKLCYAVIVGSLISSPFEADHPWVLEGLKLTHQLLGSCEPVAGSLVQQFRHCIQVADGTWQRALVWGLLQVLNDPLLNGVLRRLAGEVTEAVVATINTVCEEELRRQLEVAVKKYGG